MKIKNTVKKGFTLIELIIVLAIFSIIMVLVMSFIDPVSKVMSKTSVRERTASYVDNIGEYLEKSMRYAQYVRVFEGDFSDRKKADSTDSSLNIKTTEEKAVIQFVDDYFDGAIDSSGNPLTGKVHVLKLCNDNTLGSDKPGTIYETIYDFSAGMSVVYQVENPSDHSMTYTRRWFDDDEPEMQEPVPPATPAGYIPAPIGNEFRHSVITATSVVNQPVINPEHFENYSYYYRIGYFNFNPVPASKLSEYSGVDTTTDKFYSRLDLVRTGYGSQSFSLCTVAYQNDKKGNNMIYSTRTDSTDSTLTENVKLFLSPSYMNMTGTSLINQKLLSDTKRAEIFRYERVVGPDVIDPTAVTDEEKAEKNKYAGQVVWADDAHTVPKMKALNITDVDAPIGEAFTHYTVKPDDPTNPSENIYFIYVIPSEVTVE